jgi:hypothetical protein
MLHEPAVVRLAQASLCSNRSHLLASPIMLRGTTSPLLPGLFMLLLLLNLSWRIPAANILLDETCLAYAVAWPCVGRSAASVLTC